VIIDISPILHNAMAVWPGDEPFVCSGSSISTTLHAGAHVDAPNHMLPDGGDITSWPLEIFVGRCNVIQIDADCIEPRHLVAKTIDAPRVLFRTNRERAWLSPELIDALQGIVLVGIDTASVDHPQTLDVHQLLASKKIASLEGIVLDGVAEGAYELIALPLRIRGGDASPVRAVLRTLD